MYTHQIFLHWFVGKTSGEENGANVFPNEKKGDGFRQLIFWKVNYGVQMPQAYATTLLKRGVMDLK